MHELTPAHRAAIEAAIPAGVEVTPEFWAELIEIITGYQLLSARRARYDVKAERRRWQHLEKSVAALAPQLGERLVLAVERQAKNFAAFHYTWREFRGTKNPYRCEFLYRGVLHLWTDHLGGELKYSIAIDGAPSGPLVRFFVACIEPILGADTPYAGIADIVDRERKSRDRTSIRKAVTNIRSGVNPRSV